MFINSFNVYKQIQASRELLEVSLRNLQTFPSLSHRLRFSRKNECLMFLNNFDVYKQIPVSPELLAIFFLQNLLTFLYRAIVYGFTSQTVK